MQYSGWNKADCTENLDILCCCRHSLLHILLSALLSYAVLILWDLSIKHGVDFFTQADEDIFRGRVEKSAHLNLVFHIFLCSLWSHMWWKCVYFTAIVFTFHGCPMGPGMYGSQHKSTINQLLFIKQMCGLLKSVLFIAYYMTIVYVKIIKYFKNEFDNMHLNLNNMNENCSSSFVQPVTNNSTVVQFALIENRTLENKCVYVWEWFQHLIQAKKKKNFSHTSRDWNDRLCGTEQIFWVSLTLSLIFYEEPVLSFILLFWSWQP